jgi:hypothetical protein
MKFTWFNLMPWPYLPDGFRETRVASVADGGHMLLYERPADLAREVTTFLSGPSA